MVMEDSLSRRDILEKGGAGLAAVASGCLGENSSQSENGDTGSDTESVLGGNHESAYDHPELYRPRDGEVPVYQFPEDKDEIFEGFDIMKLPEEDEESSENRVGYFVRNDGNISLNYVENYELEDGNINELDEKGGETASFQGEYTRWRVDSRELFRLTLDKNGELQIVEADTADIPVEGFE
jgi:hypothetical protein